MRAAISLWKKCAHFTRLYKAFFFFLFADAQTLDATARLTNINFTAELHNTSSQAYRSLTESITDEVHVLQGLSVTEYNF